MQRGFSARIRAVALAASLPLMLAGGVVHAQVTGAVITTGATKLGVNQTGELNFTGNDGFLYGVFRDPIGDAISPGCPCEGWGVAATVGGSREAVFLNQSAGNGGVGTGNTFAFTANSATSLVNMAAAPVSVRHTYAPSAVADVFQVQVTITNNTGSAIGDVVYRRAMDWDVPPTPFSEFVTHSGVTANLEANGGNVRYASNNGFATSDPRVAAGEIPVNVPTVNTDFSKAGVSDHGSVFDFAFGDLAAGASRIFNIFYGSAANLASAVSKVAALGMEVFSLGQSNANTGGGGEGGGGVEVALIDEGPGEEGPGDGEIVEEPPASTDSANDDSATFIFGFRGVGGVEPGSSQELPILPIVTENQFVFEAPVAGRWYDPPADGFDITLFGGATMKLIKAPVGFSDLIITIDGVVVDSDFDAGETFSFAAGVSSFRITGIGGRVDSTDPDAFPLFMDWDGTATRMTWDPILVTAPIPEPSTYALMLLGLAGVITVARRRARAA